MAKKPSNRAIAAAANEIDWDWVLEAIQAGIDQSSEDSREETRAEMAAEQIQEFVGLLQGQTHLSSDGETIPGPSGPACRCQSCRSGHYYDD